MIKMVDVWFSDGDILAVLVVEILSENHLVTEGNKTVKPLYQFYIGQFLSEHAKLQDYRRRQRLSRGPSYPSNPGKHLRTADTLDIT